jgi:hypothetical protein
LIHLYLRLFGLEIDKVRVVSLEDKGTYRPSYTFSFSSGMGEKVLQKTAGFTDPASRILGLQAQQSLGKFKGNFPPSYSFFSIKK